MVLYFEEKIISTESVENLTNTSDFTKQAPLNLLCSNIYSC